MSNGSPDKIKFDSTLSDTELVDFTNATFVHPKMTTSTTQADLNAINNGRSSLARKVFPKEEHIKQAMALLCALTQLTPDECIKAAETFHNHTCLKECNGLNTEDVIIGKLSNCFKTADIPNAEKRKTKIFHVTKQDLIKWAVPSIDTDEPLKLLSKSFDHINRTIGYEVSSGKTYIHMDETIFLKLSKRRLQQQYDFCLILHAAELMEETGEFKLTSDELARLKTMIQSFKSAEAKEEALTQTKGPKTETNVGANFIAHKFFPGITCLNDLLAELHCKLTNQQGEFYIYQLSNFMRMIADILCANIVWK